MGYQSLFSFVQFIEHALRVPCNALDVEDESASHIILAFREPRSSRKERLGHSTVVQQREAQGGSESKQATWFSLGVRLAEKWGDVGGDWSNRGTAVQSTKQ